MNYRELFINDNDSICTYYVIHRLQQIPRVNVTHENGIYHFRPYFTLKCDNQDYVNTILKTYKSININECNINLMLRAYDKGYTLIGTEFRLCYPRFTTLIMEEDHELIYKYNFHTYMNLEYLALPLAMRWLIKFDRHDLIDYYYNHDTLSLLWYSDDATLQYILKKYSKKEIKERINVHPIILATKIGYHYDNDVFKWLLNNFDCDIIHCFQCVCNTYNQERINYMSEKYELIHENHEEEIIDLEIL